jgi:Protein of unknown function VcgC/VcgE (DUF2780)
MKLSCVLLIALVTATSATAQAQSAAHTQSTPETQPAATRRTANPELVSTLASALGTTPKQAEGAAGSLFAAAKSRLQPSDWSQVAKAVPGMAGLLKAVPSSAVGTSGSAELGALANAVGLNGGGSLGTLAEVAAAFNKLGLPPELVARAIPVITNYVSTHANSRVAQLLAGALQK